MFAKFDDSSVSCLRDIIGGAKFKVGPNPLLRVICYCIAEI